ncbi:MAG: DinB family protein [Candidatus Promineifilaceae bacterium]
MTTEERWIEYKAGRQDSLTVEERLVAMQGSMEALRLVLISAETNIQFPPDEWDASGIAAHMLVIEIEFWNRIQRIASDAEENPHFPYHWNTGWDFDMLGLHTSLNEWATWRKRLSALVRTLTPKQLGKTGVHAYFGDVTVADLLKIMSDHDLEHLEDLKKNIG